MSRSLSKAARSQAECSPAELDGSHHHVGEPRMDGDVSQSAAVWRQGPLSVERAELPKQVARLGQRTGRRRIEP